MEFHSTKIEMAHYSTKIEMAHYSISLLLGVIPGHTLLKVNYFTVLVSRKINIDKFMFFFHSDYSSSQLSVHADFKS